MSKIVLSAVMVLGLVAACGSDDKKPSLAPACEAIANRCHPVQTEAAQECHENAEGKWTAAECTANAADCNTKCPLPEDAGVN